MIDPENDISNFDCPIAGVIREALSAQKRYEVLNAQPKVDFVSARVDVYLHELEAAMHAGYDELGAKNAQ